MKTLKWLGLTIGAILLALFGLTFSIFQIFFRLCIVGLKFLSLGTFTSDFTLWYYFKQIWLSLLVIAKSRTFKQLAIAFDNLAGSLIFGSKHTVSAITGYKSFKNEKFYLYLEKFIDSMFGDGHCNREAWDEKLITDNLVNKL